MTDIDTREKRFVLGIAYQAGKNPLIKRGADGHRDFFSAEELEIAAHMFLRKGGMESGVMHIDGTLGHVEVAESYIYRGPEWDCGNGVIVKSGDWLIGAYLDEVAWDLVKSGKITGWSPQGSGRRIRSEAVAA